MYNRLIDKLRTIPRYEHKTYLNDVLDYSQLMEFYDKLNMLLVTVRTPFICKLKNDVEALLKENIDKWASSK